MQRHGEGTMTYEDGGVMSGSFQNDAPDGFVRMQFVNGAVYEGSYGAAGM